MSGWLIAVLVYLVAASLFEIGMIGRKRAPRTPIDAIGGVIEYAALGFCIIMAVNP